MAANKHIAAVTSDLTLATKLQETVVKGGGTWRRLKKEDEAGRGQPPALLLVDVTDPDAIDVIRVARESEGWKEVPILAFGRHKHVDLLERARAAGAGEVIPRSRFAKEYLDRLHQILKPPAPVPEPLPAEPPPETPAKSE